MLGARVGKHGRVGARRILMTTRQNDTRGLVSEDNNCDAAASMAGRAIIISKRTRYTSCGNPTVHVLKAQDVPRAEKPLWL